MYFYLSLQGQLYHQHIVQGVTGIHLKDKTTVFNNIDELIQFYGTVQQTDIPQTLDLSIYQLQSAFMNEYEENSVL